MSTKTLQGQFTLRCMDQRLVQPLILDKKKILIGSNDHCDYQINEKSICSYHAFILLKGEGFMVKDLHSESGVFVNGQRVKDEAFIGAGDVLTLGTMSFAVESMEDAPPVFTHGKFDEDEEILPVAPTFSSVGVPEKEGLIFIDGEFCDIQFDDSGFKPLVNIPVVKYNPSGYIELDETEAALEIAHNVKDRRLEVVSYVNGLMMDVTYLSFKNGDYFLSPEKKAKSDIVFHTLARTKIFSIKNGELRFYPTESVTPSVVWDKIKLNEPLFLTHGTEQISFRFVEQATRWNGIPFLYRDREFFKNASKVFASFFIPFLLLLLVDIPKPEKVKEEIAVIYKLPEQMKEAKIESEVNQEVAVAEPTSQTENTGHKETEQAPAAKPEFAQASQDKKVVAKATSPNPTPQKSQEANPTPAQAAPVAAVKPVKAYSFKSSVAMGSLVSDAPKINTTGSAGKGSGIKDATFNSGTSDNGALVAGANIGVGKFNGADSKGSGTGSYGSRGLAAKAGFDSSYLEPKTVVLGSMDPELLRKILREYIPQFRHCYQRELIANSDKIKGVIDLNFTINGNGKVSKFAIKVKDAQFSQKGVGCMGQVLGLIEFPKPKGGGVVDVRQPLNFLAETEKI